MVAAQPSVTTALLGLLLRGLGRLLLRRGVGGGLPGCRVRDGSLLGGDPRKSEAHLRKALTHKPDSVISLLFLAETLLDLKRGAEARAALQAAIEAPLDPEWTPEDVRFKVQARQLLATLK